MAHFVTDRIVVGLYQVGAIGVGAAVVVVAGATGWTTTPDGLINATLIATFMLALPGAALVLLAFWLDGQAARLEGRARRRHAPERDDAARHPFREPAVGYVLALLATLAAWGLRALLEAYLPGNVPFITFFLAVAVAGWLGGFGPAIFATMLSACISRWFYMVPVHAFRFDDARQAVVIGLFVFVCIGGHADCGTARRPDPLTGASPAPRRRGGRAQAGLTGSRAARAAVNGRAFALRSRRLPGLAPGWWIPAKFAAPPGRRHRGFAMMQGLDQNGNGT